MIYLRGSVSSVLSILLCLGLTGCFLAGENQLDERKEPHFLTGMKRRSNMDYKGAIDSFEKALAFNPRSASAHLELALLFETQEKDYVAAIYHYERFLRLRNQPNDGKPFQEHIDFCKMELAKTVSVGPLPPSTQFSLERLHTVEAENAELKRKLAYYESSRQTGTNQPSLPSVISTVGNLAVKPPPNQSPSIQSNAPPARLPSTGAVKTHSVKPSETPSSIARQYGVSVTTLMAANPGLDPRRLRIGQSLTIPAR